MLVYPRIRSDTRQPACDMRFELRLRLKALLGLKSHAAGWLALRAALAPGVAGSGLNPATSG